MIEIFFIKILKKLDLLKYLNFTIKRIYNEKSISIPFVNGIGLTNLMLKNEWLDMLIKIFVQEKNKTFVDVGVNIGQSLIRLKTACPQVKYLGFEPNSTCTGYTQQLIKLNAFSNCMIQNAALSSGVSNLILEKTSATDSRASLISALRPDYFEDKEHIIALDYDSFYLDEDICFVKIDVEGGEYEVIQGMVKAIEKYQPIITCEVLDSLNAEVLNFTQQRVSLVCELLASLNYGIIQLQKRNEKIVFVKKIDKIIIKQWTEESYDFNDYLFYPLAKEEHVLLKLESVI